MELVSRKLSRIRTYMRDLGNHGRIESIGSDIVIERFMEFTLQQVIQVIIDIGNHIISDENWEEPKTSREIFEILGIHRVISKNVENELKSLVGFRNLLVHEYVELDKEIERKIYNESQNIVGDFESEIVTFLSNQGTKSN